MIPMPSGRVLLGAAAVLEGAILVTFCACSNVLVDRHAYDLSPGEYAMLFLPQILTAVLAALIAARAARRVPRGRVLRAGLAFGLAAMALLLLTLMLGERLAVDHPILLVANGLAGAGFGLAYPALTAFALDVNPVRPERSILALNALLVAGMLAVPTLEVLLLRAGPWWVSPAVLAVLVGLVIVASAHARLGPDAARSCVLIHPANRVPAQLKIYTLLVLLAGVCAVLCVVWPQAAVARPEASYLGFKAVVLGAFWAALVMLGRLVFAVIDRRHSWRRTASVAVFLLPIAVAFTGLAMRQAETAVVGIFVLAAVASAAFLPLTAQPGRDYLVLISVVVAAGIAGLYPLGLGIAMPTLDAVRHRGATLLVIFTVTTAVAVVAGIASAGILSRRPVAANGPDGPDWGTRETATQRSASSAADRRLLRSWRSVAGVF